MITLNEKIVAIWFLKLDETSDYLGALVEIEAEKEYQLTYRFRYYADSNVFESKDKKNWYVGTIISNRKQCVEEVRKITRILAQMSENSLYELINDGDFDKFMEEFSKAPFVHSRKATKEEEEEIRAMRPKP